MEEERARVAVSVRTLVEFVWKRGSIRSGSVPTVQDMQEGSAAHRKLQSLAKEGDEGYRAEVRCALPFDAGGLWLDVRGQMDGLSRAGDVPRIDEIKTIRVPASEVDPNDRFLHWAQAKVYGWILCHDESLPAVELQLIYYNPRTGDISRDRQSFPANELRAFFEETCREYAVWQRWRLGHLDERNRSAAALQFPFPFRPGQRTAAGQVYRTLRDGGTLMLQAPTGVGKSLATVFPGVKAQGEGRLETLFYLTAKTSGRAAAMNALHQLEDAGLCCRAVQLTAKEKVCPHGLRCNPSDCPLADGYYDRFREAVMELLTTQTLVTPDILLAASEKHRVCPFELSLDLSSWCDCVVGDYNHLIDPVARLQRFFGGEERTSHAVLLDEAHNLVDRGREAFSAELSRRALDDAGKLVREAFPKLQRRIRKMGTPFRRQAKLMKTAEGEKLERAETEFPSELFEAAEAFCESYLDLLRDEAFAPYKEQLVELYFAASLFVTVSGFYDEKYTTCWERRGGDLVVRLYCVDPSRLLRKSYERCRSAVLFSATLLPREYYAAALSDDPIPWAEIPSPFPKENLLVLFGEPVSTRYRDRERSYRKVAAYIRRAVSHKTGNYLAFLPSFAYLDAIRPLLEDEDAGYELLAQEPRMDESARAEFLARFERYGERTLLGLCVVGGVFAEGVDLTGERLSGAIVVGVGLPTVCFERDIIRARMDQNGLGYKYAYLYPGLNRVFQAAGRVIRTERDRGFVLLLDDRYLSGEYTRLYPPHWANNRVCRSLDDLDAALRAHMQPKPGETSAGSDETPAGSDNAPGGPGGVPAGPNDVSAASAE